MARRKPEAKRKSRQQQQRRPAQERLPAGPGAREVLATGLEQIAGYASEMYLLAEVLAPLGTEPEEAARQVATVRTFALALGKLAEPEATPEVRWTGALRALDGLLKRVPAAPEKNAPILSWTALRGTLTVDLTPHVVYNTVVPIGWRGVPWEPNPDELRALLDALRELLRYIRDPALRRQLEEIIRLLRSGLGGGLTLGALAEILEFLFRWLQFHAKVGAAGLRPALEIFRSRVMPILVRWAIYIAEVEAAASAAMTALLLKLLAIAAAFGIGMAIGWLIDRIRKADGRTVTEALGDWLYGTFWQSEADKLHAAENAMMALLGRYRDRINAGETFTDEEKNDGIGAASMLIALANRKLQLGYLSASMAQTEIRRAQEVIDALSR